MSTAARETRLSPEIVERLTRAQLETTRTFAVHSPIDNAELMQVADCDASDARRAADRAAATFASWKETTAYERSARASGRSLRTS